MMSEVKISVIASQGLKPNTTNITIEYGHSQPYLNVVDSANLLIAGASLLVKSCSKYDLGIKDYELLEQLVNHLVNEFVSTSSYEDAKVKIKQDENSSTSSTD
jgi:hypothetical protein